MGIEAELLRVGRSGSLRRQLGHEQDINISKELIVGCCKPTMGSIVSFASLASANAAALSFAREFDFSDFGKRGDDDHGDHEVTKTLMMMDFKFLRVED